MATKLVIVESPTKAHKIGDYLGKGYTVMASVGHIRDLAQPSQVPAADKAKFGKFGVDVNDGFKPYYIVDGDKKRTVSELKSALKNADELYLATDEDREGEAIAWHLVQTLKPEVPVKRMVFHEITKNAINASLNNTRDVDGNMVDAQETRRILDRLYGYELSPVLWRKVGPGLSAGRVQSVATRLIVERERERMAFKRAPYWDIVATLSAPDALGERAEFSARMIALGGKRLAGSKDFGADGQLTPDGFAANVRQLDEAGATAVASALKTADFTVMSMETKPYRRRPQPPFTTSTLQQTAGNRLGMGARAVMRAAQSLYASRCVGAVQSRAWAPAVWARSSRPRAWPPSPAFRPCSPPPATPSPTISATSSSPPSPSSTPPKPLARRKPTSVFARRARASTTRTSWLPNFPATSCAYTR